MRSAMKRLGLMIATICVLWPTSPRAERRLNGRFQSSPIEGVVESYRFHSDSTYEWTKYAPGERFRLWACGRYELRGELLVLLEDRSEISCSHHRQAPRGSVSEQWLFVDSIRVNVLRLGGEEYARSETKPMSPT